MIKTTRSVGDGEGHNELAVRSMLTVAVQALAAAGISSPRAEAEQLAAHALEVPRSRLLLVSAFTPEQGAAFAELVRQRAQRIPLQHVLGYAVLGPLEVAVGPGVFIPRPETELLYAWACARLAESPVGQAPIVVDLCTGSGALALAIAHTFPEAHVHAVELDPAALSWARRNAAVRQQAGDTAITVHAADATSAAVLSDLDGSVDVLVTNPPYVPQDALLPPEVAGHDPAIALFGGPDGLSVIRQLLPVVTRLLRPGGTLAVEHDDSHGDLLRSLCADSGAFAELAEHSDLAGKPRFVTAVRR